MSRVKLGDVAVEVRETSRNTDGLPAVGLEHLTPGDLHLSQWPETSNNTFTKLFHEGQILFGRRRAYLKKAAVAPFDGICSGDITVIAAKPEKIMPRLLPFIIGDDRFFDYAMEKSAGSLSPRVKWAQLAEYEFDLPEKEKQPQLADLLWAMERTKKAYQGLLAQTDELVKSQFVEMFGDPEFQTENLTNLGRHIDILNGFAFRGELFTDVGVPVIKIGNVNRADFSRGSMQYYQYDPELSRFEVHPGDVLISLTGTVGKEDFGNVCMVSFDYDRYYLNQRNARLILHDELVPEYVVHLLQNSYIRRKLIQSGTGVRQCHLHNKDLDGIRFVLPDRRTQERFAGFIRQTDKSKFACEKQEKMLDVAIKTTIFAGNMIQSD